MKWLGCAIVACAAGIAHAQPGCTEAETRAFMANYARDIANGDRQGVVRRYDPEGTFLLVAGGLEFESHSRIAEEYAKQWSPPLSFEWRDLHFATAGPDAVVKGHFVWGGASGPLLFTYTGLLRCRQGMQFIRMEEESPVSR